MTKIASWLGQGLVTLGIAALVVSVLLVPQHQLLADEGGPGGGGTPLPCSSCHKVDENGNNLCKVTYGANCTANSNCRNDANRCSHCNCNYEDGCSCS